MKRVYLVTEANTDPSVHQRVREALDKLNCEVCLVEANQPGLPVPMRGEKPVIMIVPDGDVLNLDTNLDGTLYLNTSTAIKVRELIDHLGIDYIKDDEDCSWYKELHVNDEVLIVSQIGEREVYVSRVEDLDNDGDTYHDNCCENINNFLEPKPLDLSSGSKSKKTVFLSRSNVCDREVSKRIKDHLLKTDVQIVEWDNSLSPEQNHKVMVECDVMIMIPPKTTVTCDGKTASKDYYKVGKGQYEMLFTYGKENFDTSYSCNNGKSGNVYTASPKKGREEKRVYLVTRVNDEIYLNRPYGLLIDDGDWASSYGHFLYDSYPYNDVDGTTLKESFPLDKINAIIAEIAKSDLGDVSSIHLAAAYMLNLKF